MNRNGSIPANDNDNPEYAEIGRRLMRSGDGIVTEHGILFVDDEIPFEEPYDGQVFPPYLYDSDLLVIGKAEYRGKVEYLYLPCERAAIDKAFSRLGATDPDAVSIHNTYFYIALAAGFLIVAANVVQNYLTVSDLLRRNLEGYG